MQDKCAQTVGIQYEYHRGTAVNSANIRQSRDKPELMTLIQSFKLTCIILYNFQKVNSIQINFEKTAFKW